MRSLPHPIRWLSALTLSCLLAACGGGGTDSSGGVTTSPAVPDSGALAMQAGAPVFLGDTAKDGLNWINYRRSQLGLPALASNELIGTAASKHSLYQQINGVVTHVETAGLPGFTGATLLDRFASAGYLFGNGSYAYGEVISSTTDPSGFYEAEELITAIYHRFVIFEPKFKEIGTGAAVSGGGISYFTCDFAANNGLGSGLGAGKFAVWPTGGQTGVPTIFYSDYESPDPVPETNAVGYPISVHADLDGVLAVQAFSVRPHGASGDLAVKLLTAATDKDTSHSAAAIIPMSVLSAATTYDVSFSGTLNGVPVGKTWSFTTR